MSSDADYTPGPWNVGFSDGSSSEPGMAAITAPCEPDKYESTEQIVVAGGDGFGVSYGVRREADARLIAAAPALLEALRDMNTALWASPSCQKGLIRCRCVACTSERARAAIRSAIGPRGRNV